MLFCKNQRTTHRRFNRFRMQKQMAQHIQNTSLNYSNNVGSTSSMNKLNNDAALLMVFSTNSVIGFVGKSVIFLITMIIVFHIDFICGIAAFVEMPLIFLLYKVFSKKLLNISHKVAENNSLYFTRLYEMLRDIRHIKLNDLSNETVKRFEKQVFKSLEVDEKEIKLEFIYNYIQGNMDVLLKIFLFFMVESL